MASKEDDGNFGRMQHLIDEMDRSNQRINLFNEKFDVEELSDGLVLKGSSPNEKQFEALLDDACRSEESDGASIQEIPAHRFPKDLDDSGCDEVINSAIAEVSKDFLAGLQTSGTQNHYGDSDESRISSDTDFKLISGMPSYARYPETAAGLSDTDWNPYGTESDNNQSPRLQSVHSQSLMKESKSFASNPFQPIFNSTCFNAITPNSADKVLLINSQSHLSDIREMTERQSSSVCRDLKPDVTANQSPIAAKADWAITPVKGHHEPLSKVLSQMMADQEHKTRDSHDAGKNKTRREGTSSKDSASSDEEKKMIASTSSTGYSSAASGVKTKIEIDNEKLFRDHNQPQHISIFERAKRMGIPEDILYDRPKSTSNYHLSNSREWNERGKTGGLSDYDSDDHLGQKVHHLLSETAYLSNDSRRTNKNKAAIDYSLLQKDLQEIQDNLESLSSNSPATEHGQDWRKEKDHSILSSEKEGDMPSRTSTPDGGGNHHAWDFTEVIGSLANRIQTNRTYHHHSRVKKMNLNSDGDETRSSDSSHKSEDHNIDASERPGDFQSNLDDLHTSRDVDKVLSTFRDQRHQLESRYQQLSNQGLAEKVFRILTNQDPESQADGILSEVSAEEKELKAKLAMKQHNRDFNFSSNSSFMEDLHRSCALPDDVRKKLDLSGLSSVDSSRVLDKSSFNLPSASKGFSAFDDAKRLLSSQTEKVFERTFNHSIEMRYPQSIQCYPLFVENSDKTETENPVRDDYEPNEETVAGIQWEKSSSSQPADKTAASSQETHDKEKHDSPTSSDQGSTYRQKEKYRPYRPPGSKEVYYTESDTASVADSVTTMESTHIGSDDAAGPHLPLTAYGSRKDVPNVTGIYGTRKNLSTVQEATEPSLAEEKTHKDDKELKSSQAASDEQPSRPNLDRISSQQDGRSERLRPTVTTQRYGTSIWAKRDENTTSLPTNKGEEKPEETPGYSRREPISSHSSVSVARRDARWDNRIEEQGRSSSHIMSRGNVEEQRPSRSTVGGMDFADPANEEQDFSLPTNAFISEVQTSYEQPEREPMSLRIQLAYKDVPKAKERNSRNHDPSMIYGDRPRSHLTDEDRNFRVSERSYQRGVYNHNLVRSASDENLNSSHQSARLSPAFRRALSPELMNSIGSRSPLLGRNIERSLAGPASDYPYHLRSNYSSSSLNWRPYSLNDPPTFLARERSFSPRACATSPTNERILGGRVSPMLARNSPLHSHHTASTLDGRSKTRTISPNPRPHTFESNQDGNDRYPQRQHSPSFTKRKIELTLEGMSSESEADIEIDAEPMSKRAQLLKDALSHERETSIDPDINAMWEQFKAYNESDDSSINTARMEAVTDLLKSPSTHLVSQYLKEREEYRIERQERVEREKEKRIKEQAHKSSSSEDDFNERYRYRELLAAKEEERMKRRSTRKKKGKNGAPAKVLEVSRSEKRQEDKCTENLYSIPEDRSSEQSPSKLSSGPIKCKPNTSSQPNVIDPNMFKLREKISRQRTKVDRNMMKEIVKIEKLKKLEQLLKAKRDGQITSEMLEQQLEELSSTSYVASDNSHESNKLLEANSGVLSDDSTTVKDSSGEMQMWKMRKESRLKEREMRSKQEDKLIVRNNNNNKENKPAKHDSTHFSKDRDVSQRSEIKLLKMVREGYLTAEEAYGIALTRTGLEESQISEDMSIISSENDGSFSSHRQHKFYSPYARSQAHTSQIRHIPKLKFSDHLDDDINRWQGQQKQTCRNHNHDGKEFQSSLPSKLRGRDKAAKFMTSVPGDYKRERGRLRSHSPPDGSRHKQGSQRQDRLFTGHGSPVRARSSSPSRRKDFSLFHGKDSQGHQSRMKKYPSENQPPISRKGINRSVAWHVDMNGCPDEWKESSPLQEIPLNRPSRNGYQFPDSDVEKKDATTRQRRQKNVDEDIWRKANHPHGMSTLQWEKIVCQDKLASKTNHWQVDPFMDRVQYILNRPASTALSGQSSFTSEKDVDPKKSLSKLSLQDAFSTRKQDFISKCRERQKRLCLGKEDRQMQECLRLEREAIFAEQERMAEANLYAHPYSDNLYQPKRRILTKQEMKEMTARKYKNLPEVVEKKEEHRRKIEHRLNRLRANLFNKKVQKEVLKKRYKQRD